MKINKRLTAAWKDRNKLYAEGDMLYIEGDLCFINAVIAVHGPETEISWAFNGCTLSTGETFGEHE